MSIMLHIVTPASAGCHYPCSYGSKKKPKKHGNPGKKKKDNRNKAGRKDGGDAAMRDAAGAPAAAGAVLNMVCLQDDAWRCII